jgi:hypothetical protein
MEADVRIEKVDEFEIRGGNTRYVVRDDQPPRAQSRPPTRTPTRTEFGAAAK